jgi:hypothetical protein
MKTMKSEVPITMVGDGLRDKLDVDGLGGEQIQHHLTSSVGPPSSN